MSNYKTNPDLFIEKAEILKALAHPSRLCIVKSLCENGPCNVRDMEDCLGEVQSTVSQHIAKLKAANIIVGKKKGTSIYYSIANQEVCELIRHFIKD